MRKIAVRILGILGLACLASGILYKIRGSASISVIEGSDGPTSIFIAGKVGSSAGMWGIIIGILLLIIALFLYRKKER